MTLETNLVLGILCLTVLLILGLTLVLMYRQSRQSQQTVTGTLTTLLAQQVAENQSLRNQLRAADPMTLHSLQAATSPSKDEDEYVPGEDIRYQQQLADAGLTIEDIPDEFADRGWTGNAVPDSGGTPVTFG